MNSNNKMTIHKQLVAGDVSPVALLDRTSQMLTEVDTVEDLVDVRNQIESIRTYIRKSDKTRKVLLEAACQVIRAEHCLGRILAKMIFAHASPGNQWTGKLDRSHCAPGPIFLEELNLSKDASSRAKRIGRIPEDVLENWMAHLCAQGKEPSLRGADRLARSLEPSDSSKESGKPDRCEQEGMQIHEKSSPVSKHTHQKELLQLAANIQKHAKLAIEQFGKLHKLKPLVTEETEVRYVRQNQKEIAEFATEMIDLLSEELPYLPNPKGGGKASTSEFLQRFRQVKAELNRDDCQYQSTP